MHKSQTSTMEETISSWMTQNKDTAEAFTVKIIEIHPEFVKLEIGGYTIQLIIPSSFYDASVAAGSAFLALYTEEQDKQMDESLEEVLQILNEKLERVKFGHNCLHNVLDTTLGVFRRYGCKIKTGPCVKVERNCHPSGSKAAYLYKAAEEARMECQLALSRADKESIKDGMILPWCCVSVDLTERTVILEMEIDGIMASNDVAKALGFGFGRPITITMGFRNGLWLIEEEISVEAFGSVEVSVKSDQMGVSVDRMTSLRGLPHYGPQVLVPELVRDFFSKRMDNGLLDGFGQAEGSDNIFVRLLIFIGAYLSTLGRWCCNCKKKLSGLSRWWSCDAELCLFQHEEFRAGVSILQELQNSKLIELEISLALAAASTHRRNVFEPYPAFLLSNREIRGRSGFFSTVMTRSSESSQNSQIGGQIQSDRDAGNEEMCGWENKKMDLLSMVISSFPPVAEMQKCENENELKSMLSASVQELLKSNDVYAKFLQNELFKEEWLPYNVLRFVLFTNRLTLTPLKEKCMLNMPRSSYQFAVFYDGEREQYYDHCRTTRGSFYAYHGSPTENWYSILRNGLRCLSQTPYMSNGMAHGRGIYFSTDVNTSCGYSRPQPGCGWKNGKWNVFHIMAICEIFLDPNYYAKGTHVVIPPEHEVDIAIRYLIVLTNESCTNSLSPSCNLQLHDHYKDVRSMYVQKHENRDLFRQQQLAIFEKRKIFSQSSS